MRKSFILLSFLLCAAASLASVQARYDERIELMSVLCNLSGFSEYDIKLNGSYTSDIKEHFAAATDHPAIRMMKRLRNKKGIGFDAPMAYAVSMEKSGDGFRMADSVIDDDRWHGVDLDAVADTISAFYRDSRFDEFFSRHKPFYEEACKKYNDKVVARFNQDWYARFYGMPPTDNFEIIIGFGNGGCNYGPHRQLPGRPKDVYAIVGYALDQDNEPYFSSDPASYLRTLIHEFNHSFINPLTADERFADRMGKAGDDMLLYSRDVMRRIAYGSGETLVNESLVRAAVIFYLMDNGHTGEEVREGIIDEMQSGFYWMPELVGCLMEYSGNRDKYPSIDAFYDRLTGFFSGYAAGRREVVDSVLHRMR